MLLDAGAEVDAVDAHGATPLWRAVFDSNGRGELVVLLRERGADPHEENRHGSSPLGLARTIGSFDVAQYFRDLT
jgi:ankyrin repeat protein